MRIIGGALRGRRLTQQPGSATRPTSDRVREALASALEARGLIEDAVVLDLFAGTGALGFEALSRGARDALLIDGDRRVVGAIRKDAAQLGVSERAIALELELLSAPAKVEAALRRAGVGPFTLVFADAPYASTAQAVTLLERLARAQLLAAGAAVVIEHASRDALARPNCFAELAHYRYGDTAVTMWESVATAEGA